ncbi:uncharacterized protein P174DRAFT_436423 [Aspergillus novofumigatus IBT 16806]|uniref:Uncharacterized protein n=1 Tax=Aspergillus novofumigatus (strain IBT 16806) TaxID=1392255 RepID=A0A2I1CK75_ASPN1|nr:uncharacterized protein P174DRAFT_436423 [Aspergillus novofumigatus IBT 16806]PKX98024.1 hypothetical protein P174DRAFT_436423 [Aspergillus novofumigatus IBT 16806]
MAKDFRVHSGTTAPLTEKVVRHASIGLLELSVIGTSSPALAPAVYLLHRVRCT